MYVNNNEFENYSKTWWYADIGVTEFFFKKKKVKNATPPRDVDGTENRLMRDNASYKIN